MSIDIIVSMYFGGQCWCIDVGQQNIVVVVTTWINCCCYSDKHLMKCSFIYEGLLLTYINIVCSCIWNSWRTVFNSLWTVIWMCDSFTFYIVESGTIDCGKINIVMDIIFAYFFFIYMHCYCYSKILNVICIMIWYTMQ